MTFFAYENILILLIIRLVRDRYLTKWIILNSGNKRKTSQVQHYG
ncbi:MAG: hypothetical protein V7K79_02910 [Nostoc sp.]